MQEAREGFEHPVTSLSHLLLDYNESSLSLSMRVLDTQGSGGPPFWVWHRGAVYQGSNLGRRRRWEDDGKLAIT